MKIGGATVPVGVSNGQVKTPVGDAPVIPLLLIFIGGYLTWFGVHYWRDEQTKWPSDPIKDVLQGKGIPEPVPSATIESQIESSTSQSGSGGGSPGGSATGDEIAADAKKYAGHAYLYGGAPGLEGGSPWDCSSFCNWVIGHDMKLAIPGEPGGGNHYNGELHGPGSTQWMAWSGCKTITRSDVAAGDIICSPVHMGIATSNSEMFAAHDPQTGTGPNAIDGGVPGSPVLYRRLRATISSPGNPGGGGTYDTEKLKSLWVLAGGNPAKSDVAACIAMHESSGDPEATSSNPDGGENVGLWQLDTKGKGAGHSVEELKLPLTNARLAIDGSSDGSNWSAWSTASMCGV